MRFKISGSIAQLFKIVFPFALNAANIAFSVAPTEILGKVIFVPFKPFFASAIIYPFLIIRPLGSPLNFVGPLIL